jgi:serine phosphatase RsbU (regulator of sigma subunit)
MESQRVLEVSRALGAVNPDQLGGAVRSALREHYGARHVELRLVDYAMHSLQSAHREHSARPVPIAGTAQGRTFDAQEPVVVDDGADTVEVHLPVETRGDRLGVLSVTVPAEAYREQMLDELRQIGGVVAREIILAGRETDRYEVERRATRLTLAAEMQWLLLPGSSCARAEFSLGAHLEPAYAIYGDGFDWSVSETHLTVAVVNGMGQGVEAALLTNLVVSALRNARRAGLEPADQAALADEAVFAHYRGELHVSVLLMRFDLATGDTDLVDAGSPRLWRLRHGKVDPLQPDAQMPLGLFGDTDYRSEQLHTSPGDRLLIASDGLYAAASPTGELFGDRLLERTIRATRLLRAAQVPAVMLRELAGHHGGTQLDDAAVVCIDWRGGRPTS